MTPQAIYSEGWLCGNGTQPQSVYSWGWLGFPAETHKGRLPLAWGETDRLAMIRRDDEEILLMIGAFLEIHHG